MNYYRVFVHERRGDVEAVKIGWSWPAYLLPLFWMPYKKMWGHTVAFYFLTMPLVMLSVAVREMNSDVPEWVLQWLSSAPLVLLVAYVGSKGNDWYAKELVERGFKHAVLIEAPDPDRAKIIFGKEYRYDAQADAWVKYKGILL